MSQDGRAADHETEGDQSGRGAGEHYCKVAEEAGPGASVWQTDTESEKSLHPAPAPATLDDGPASGPCPE